MSNPLDRELGPDDPSPFGPKWWRDTEDSELCRRSATVSSISDDGVNIDQYHVPRSLEPTLLLEAQPVTRRRFKFMFVRFSLAIVFAASLFVANKFPSAGTVAFATDRGNETGSFETRFSEQDFHVAERPRPPPELSVNQEGPRNRGEAFPLAVTVVGSVVGASVVVDGLAAGSTLTAGGPLGANGWRLAAVDLPNALVRPPIGFAGPMDIVLELRLADDTVVDRKSARLEWAAAAPGQSAGDPIRQLDRREIADLMRRGQEFIVAGDLASARLVLQRAAEAGDSQAALMLAGTYDPIVLEKIGIQGFAPDIVQGFAPDVALARTWYKWAKEFGSTEAVRRLEMLASRDHR
jgi:hypothetical protein